MVSIFMFLVLFSTSHLICFLEESYFEHIICIFFVVYTFMFYGMIWWLSNCFEYRASMKQEYETFLREVFLRLGKSAVFKSTFSVDDRREIDIR